MYPATRRNPGPRKLRLMFLSLGKESAGRTAGPRVNQRHRAEDGAEAATK
jgi:hypothetical protein